MFGAHYAAPHSADKLLEELLARARLVEDAFRASIEANPGPERNDAREVLERAVEVFSWDVGGARARLRELEQRPAQSAAGSIRCMKVPGLEIGLAP